MTYIIGFITNIVKTILFITLFFSIVVDAQTTYYISSSEGNDSNIGTSKSTPWKTLNKLHQSWGLVGPGDSVLFKRGDSWSPSSKNNNRGSEDALGLIYPPSGTGLHGTSDNWIVIGAYGNSSDPKPYFDRENITDYVNVIRFSTASYVIIQDLQIYNSSITIRPYDDDDLTTGFHNIKFLRIDNWGDGYRGGGGIRAVNHPGAPGQYYNQPPDSNVTYPMYKIEIGYCNFSEFGGNDADAIGLLGVWRIPDALGVNFWIHHNTFINIGEEAMDIGGGNNHLIEYNYISGAYGNGIKIHSQTNHAENGIIRGNIIKWVGVNTTQTVAANDWVYDVPGGLGSAMILQNVSGFQVYNNTLFARWAISVGDRDRERFDATKGWLGYWGYFHDNIFRNNNIIGSTIWYGGIYNQYTGVPQNNTWENNNFYNQYESSQRWGRYPIPGTSDYDDHTLARFQTNFLNYTTNSTVNEPLVTSTIWTNSYNAGDLHLQESSPLVDGGVTVNGWTFDHDGNNIQGLPDIGAYEFNGVDLTAPRVQSAQILNANTVEVQFSERVTKNSAEITSNYSISNGIIINSAVLSSDSKKVTLSTSSHSNGSYIITAENIEDLSGNMIATNNTAQYSFILDLISPKLISVEVLNYNSLQINFSESLIKSTAEVIQNYAINNGITVETAVLLSPNKVQLTTSLHNVGEFSIIVSGVQDLSGNLIDPEYNSFNYSISEDVDISLLSTYDFVKGDDANIVYDKINIVEPLNLNIEDLASVKWLEPNGLAIISPTKIISQDLPTKIIDACVLSGEISIEVWLKPTKLLQTGPARIVSLSANSSGRNFTLGQSTTDGFYDIYDVRLRTTESNSNGIPSVSTEPGTVTKSLTHLVYTRNNAGITKIYLNSNEIISDSLGGDFSNWNDSFPLILANEATNDRPWLGEFYRLSVYNKVLTQLKIDSLFYNYNLTDVKKNEDSTPSDYHLQQNYPNPFNPNTKINFSIPRQGNVNIKVFNILGKEVVQLINSELQPGTYNVDFNAENLPSGIYFYQMVTDNYSEVKKMILLK